MKTAEIHTKKGVMKVEFYEQDAPKTVKNFIDLAEGASVEGARELAAGARFCGFLSSQPTSPPTASANPRVATMERFIPGLLSPLATRVLYAESAGPVSLLSADFAARARRNRIRAASAGGPMSVVAKTAVTSAA